MACGFYSSYGGLKSSPKRLAGPCSKRKTRGSRNFLARLAKGLTPKASVKWPLAAEEVDFSQKEAKRLAVPTRRLSSKTMLSLEALHC